MKRIAIFCDGTWNRSDALYPTNVVRLAQSVCHASQDDIAQLVIYLEGVGAGRGSSRLARRIDRIGGGVFGWGLTDNVVDAYRHLAFNYEEGDQLFILGFSRGAYTARSLAGLIRSCGIPSIDNIPKIPDAVAFYRDPDDATRPKSERSKEFRSWFSPKFATQAGEEEWRLEHGLPECRPLHIRYLGVWDTVGALGVPGQYKYLARLFNRQHEFHDAMLTSLVLSARHAVAIDERRRTFEPTLWGNVERLNMEARDEASIGLRREDDVKPYRQEWFPGDHGSIGGGGDVRGLANAALLWIADGARDAGLRFSEAALEPYRAAIDVSVALRAKSAPPELFERFLMLSAADREGPADAGDVSSPAVDRWRLGSTPRYRPGSLTAVAEKLEAIATSLSGDDRHTG